MGEGKAAGSVWNVGNWHWEEKNYTKWSTDRLVEVLKAFVVEDKTGTIHTINQPVVKGEASVSVRKGRRIAAFDFNVEFDWQGVHKESSEERRGKYVIRGFDVDNAQDGDYEIEVSETTGDDLGRDLKELARKEGAAKLKEFLKLNFLVPLLAIESQTEKLEEDKTKREAEQKRVEDAAVHTEAKLKMYEETKRREEEERWKKLEEEKQKAAAASCPVAIQGEGSVWNTNAYHWEEKPRTQWAQDRLKEIFSEKTTVSLLDGQISASFFNPKIKGEATVTIRKGKKIFVFDLAIAADWTAKARDDAGNFQADAKGGLEVSDFSEDNLDEFKVSVSCDDFIHPARRRVFDAMKTEGEKKIRQLLLTFVEEYKKT